MKSLEWAQESVGKPKMTAEEEPRGSQKSPEGTRS